MGQQWRSVWAPLTSQRLYLWRSSSQEACLKASYPWVHRTRDEACGKLDIAPGWEISVASDCREAESWTWAYCDIKAIGHEH